MAIWDLSTKQNWRLLLSDSRVAEYNKEATYSRYFHNPINPFITSPNSPILLIGTYSPTAKKHWFLGARASQYLYVSPSSTKELILGVCSGEKKRVGLRELTLVRFPNYNIFPYILQLEIPIWLDTIYVEVWEYLGQYSDEDESIQSIISRLESIESKLENIDNIIANLSQGNIGAPQPNTSTGFDHPDSSTNLGII